MRLYSAFKCTKFQGNWTFVFYNNFQTLTKRRKKKRSPANFRRFISRKPPVQFSWNLKCEIWNVRWWHWLAFPLQKSFDFIKVSWSYVYVKIALLFFLLITHGYGTPASWATRHTTVCLDHGFGVLASWVTWHYHVSWLSHWQCWGSYFLKVIYYILLVTSAKSNTLQLLITLKQK